MKSILNLTAFLCVAAAALYVALWAGGGVVFSGPLGTLGVGLIGIGLYLEARKQHTDAVATEEGATESSIDQHKRRRMA